MILHTGIHSAIKTALKEDIGAGDITTNSIIPADALMEGQIIAKQTGIIAGMDVVEATYKIFDPQINIHTHVAEGEKVKDRQVVASLAGCARSLLTVERTALNFLGRISGIATLTRQFVDAVVETKAIILDTRKTAPGLRMLDKLAVVRGGGQNHRLGLDDMILIKDNHIDFAGSITEAVKRIRSSGSKLKIEVEARTLANVDEALSIDVRYILLDNMTLEMMREAVIHTVGHAKLEASGNVTLENVRAIAETGVDYISIGMLTHSAKAFDVSFDYVHLASSV